MWWLKVGIAHYGPRIRITAVDKLTSARDEDTYILLYGNVNRNVHVSIVLYALLTKA